MATVSANARKCTAMQQVLERLRAMIILNEIGAGEQIRQQEMAEALGVSRVPLREAMNVLADQGLLLHRRNQGYFVAKRVPSDIAQIRRMLNLLENELYDTLAWPSDEVLEQLRELNRQMQHCIETADMTTLSELNRSFHLTIFRCSPFRLIVQEVERLWAMCDPVFLAKFGRPEYISKIVTEHEAVIEALAKQDRNSLRAQMDNHRYGSGSAPSLHDALGLVAGD